MLRKMAARLSCAKTKAIFLLITAISCVVILGRLLSLRNNLGLPFFFSSGNSSERSATINDAFEAILRVDNETKFLDPETRRFLKQAHFFVFPSKYNKVFLETLLEFDRIWRQELKRDYVLHGGTLIGAYRHGGTVPWDDDIDILVDMKYNATIEKDFAGTKFNVTKLMKKVKIRKLFFTHNGTTTNQYGHWPFIDLFFYKTQKKGTEVKVQGIFKDEFPTKYVFPVIRMPHAGHTFLAPRCPKEFSKLAVGSKIFHECCTHTYNHKKNKSRKRSCVSCSKLKGLLPFVMWARINKTHTQQLILDPHPLHRMAELYKNREENWRTGPVVFMPEC